MIKRAITLLLLALPFYLAAVQQAEGRSPGPMLEVFTGGATFYSDSFHGKKTANGERYNKNEFTAAHRSLPLGTIVRVTNLSNGNNLLVRINDRGPGKKKLILDVSRAAASKLNMIRRGVISVQVEVVADKRGIPEQRLLPAAGQRTHAQGRPKQAQNAFVRQLLQAHQADFPQPVRRTQNPLGTPSQRPHAILRRPGPLHPLPGCATRPEQSQSQAH